jgi:acid stress-induced BolA-like protein IbaG/YrbA
VDEKDFEDMTQLVPTQIVVDGSISPSAPHLFSENNYDAPIENAEIPTMIPTSCPSDIIHVNMSPFPLTPEVQLALFVESKYLASLTMHLEIDPDLREQIEGRKQAAIAKRQAARAHWNKMEALRRLQHNQVLKRPLNEKIEIKRIESSSKKQTARAHLNKMEALRRLQHNQVLKRPLNDKIEIKRIESISKKQTARALLNKMEALRRLEQKKQQLY